MIRVVMKSKSFSLSVQKGFSLVELLVVIAVIAIIAAIAIPNIAGITQAANTAKQQRNAQNIVSTYNAAIAAGLTNTPADVPAAVALIRNGVQVTIGTNTNNFFRVDGLSDTEATDAQTFIPALVNNTLVYSNQ